MAGSNQDAGRSYEPGLWRYFVGASLFAAGLVAAVTLALGAR
jgi:hypothetical protein